MNRNVLELGLIILPSLWMLFMGSTYLKWNYGLRTLLGSILIFLGYGMLTKVKSNKKMPSLSLYVGMILWSLVVFLGWILNHRANVAFFEKVLEVVYKIVPMSIQQIYWFSVCLIILYFIWQVLIFGSKYIWIYLIFHTGLLLMTIWYFHSQDLVGECSELYVLFSSLPCRFNRVFGSGGMFTLGIILLLLPTTLAIRDKQTFGNMSVITVLAVVPVWFELFYFPLHTLRETLLQSMRELTVSHQYIAGTINKGAYIIIFSFMFCIPIGLRLLNSERVKAVWVLGFSSLALILTVLIYIHALSFLNYPFVKLANHFLLFGLFLVHVLLSIVVVIGWRVQLDKGKTLTLP